jgi:hypothetical protein
LYRFRAGGCYAQKWIIKLSNDEPTGTNPITVYQEIVAVITIIIIIIIVEFGLFSTSVQYFLHIKINFIKIT